MPTNRKTKCSANRLNLDEINFQLDALRIRLLGLGSVLVLAKPDFNFPAEELRDVLEGAGEIILEECKKLEGFRPLISECALELSIKP